VRFIPIGGNPTRKNPMKITLNVSNAHKHITMDWHGISKRECVALRCHNKVWDKLGELFGYRSRTAFIDYFLDSVLAPGNLYIIADFAKYVLHEMENTEYGSPLYCCATYTTTVNVDVTKLDKFTMELATYIKNYHNVDFNTTNWRTGSIGMIVCYMVNRQKDMEFVHTAP
jgi:hypothetical protein